MSAPSFELGNCVDDDFVEVRSGDEQHLIAACHSLNINYRGICANRAKIVRKRAQPVRRMLAIPTHGVRVDSVEKTRTWLPIYLHNRHLGSLPVFRSTFLSGLGAACSSPPSPHEALYHVSATIAQQRFASHDRTAPSVRCGRQGRLTSAASVSPACPLISRRPHGSSFINSKFTFVHNTRLQGLPRESCPPWHSLAWS